MSAAPSLWTNHRKLALVIANRYYLPGQERQDVEQEALIGLWIAARGYQPERGPFKPWASTVIHRRLKTLVAQANCGKNRILTFADRDYEPPAIDMRAGERLGLIVAALDTLSELERRALANSLNGLPIGSKSADNALQRARTKLRQAA